ncbi:radical SAM protein, partial [Streptomyces lydicus]
MKATPLCNLRCTYCHFWRTGPNQVMAFDVLATTIRDALATPGIRRVEFVWHGGEVTLLRPSFLRKAIWLQEHFRRPGQRVVNSVQTNGTRLDAEWLELLRDQHISVGVSLDGPPEVHDRTRVDVGGKATSMQVRDGLGLLRENRIAHGVLMVVGDDLVEIGARRTLEYLVEIGVPAVGLLNVIPENAPQSDDRRGQYLPFDRYVRWLQELFALWFPDYSEVLAVRELAELIGKVRGGASRSCLFAGGCHGQ